jgi:iron complex outermembrane receptor protein
MKFLFVCLLTLLMACLFTYTYSQSAPSSVKGAIITAANIPAEGVTIFLLTFPDSAVFKAAISSKNGAFSISNVKPGNYIVYIHKIGYAKFYSKYQLTGKEVDMGDITLQPLTKQLNEITVTEKKDYVEVHPDKMVLNVDRSILATGNTVFDVLQTAPGVRIIDNSVLFKGGQKALVAINGKPIGALNDEQLADLLKSYPASMISQVELIPNPPARYDAAGGGGVINIILKKSKDVGFKASFTQSASVGQDYKFNSSLNTNYRSEKFNVFANYSFAATKLPRLLDIDHNITDDGLLTNIAVDYNSVSTTSTNNFNTGVDYSLTPKQTVGVLFYGYSMQTGIGKSSVTYIRNNGVLDSDITENSHVDRPIYNLNYNLNYRGAFGKDDRTSLSADVDYSTYNRSSFENVVNDFYRTDGTTYGNPLLYTDNSPSTIHIRSERVDFTEQLTKTSSIAAGLKNSQVNSDNTIQFDQQNDTSKNFLPIPSLSDHFVYTEQINAAYGSYNDKFGKGDLTLGLRVEQTLSHGISYHPDKNVTHNYTDFFPSFQLTEAIDKDNQLTVDFNRRVERPNYQDLNPFIGFISQYSYSTGNPFLNPTYINTYEVSDVFKQKYTASLRMLVSSDFTSPIYEQNDSTKVVTTTYGNIGTRYAWEAEFYIPVTLTNWWDVNADIDGAYEKYIFNADSARKNTFDFNVTLIQDFSLPYGFKAQAATSYQAPLYYGIKQYQQFFIANAGISKAILSNKGVIKLSVNDIFNSDMYKYTSQYLNVDLAGREKSGSRFVTLSFTYRFGKQTVKNATKKVGGNADDQQRLKGSENEN